MREEKMREEKIGEEKIEEEKMGGEKIRNGKIRERAAISAREYFEQLLCLDGLVASKRKLLEQCRKRRETELAETLQEELGRLERLPTEAIAVIGRLPQVRYRLLLEQRYLNGNSPAEIGAMLGVTQSRYYQLRDEALRTAEAFILERSCSEWQ